MVGTAQGGDDPVIGGGVGDAERAVTGYEVGPVAEGGEPVARVGDQYGIEVDRGDLCVGEPVA